MTETTKGTEAKKRHSKTTFEICVLFVPCVPLLLADAIPHMKLSASAISVEYSNPSTAKSGLENAITAVAMTERIAARINIDTKIL
jgi:hypothetical protein